MLETASQTTRWYPLDGGIGFGRIRISLLFRSIETRLPPNMLGWEVGTFEITSERLLATGYGHSAKLKMRTGGSIGYISRTQCQKLPEGDGVYFDLSKNPEKNEKNNSMRLPVKYRYRSPIVFEFHTANKRKADAYAVIWLHHLIDNEDTPINIPIWQTSAPARLTQNYITDSNKNNEPGLEDLKEVGRLQFRGRFKAGMDESHERFVADNDSRETFETWAACYAEGVRTKKVDKEVPDRVQTLHDESLTQGRDVLKNASDAEKRKWLAKDGADWSGAFGHDPKAYVDAQGRKRREPGKEDPLHDPHHPDVEDGNDEAPDDSDEDDDDDAQDSSDDLGIQDATNTDSGMANGVSSSPKSPDDGRASLATQRTGSTQETGISRTTTQDSKSVNKQNKRTEERKQRGMMQWKPARNAKFAKDEAVIGLRKLRKSVTGGLDGRKPGVETETGR